jgi:2-polyprenyl-3-methyl-5-hydroxy-6-metoxy-1,4-benzoquinol methylase
MDVMRETYQKVRPFARKQTCDLCGADRFQVVGNTDRRGDFLTTIVCRQCGLVSHGRIPTDNALELYYSKNYRRDYHGEITPSPHRVIRAWKNGQRLRQLLEPHLQPGDHVFEVGAGIGCTVKAFQLAGYDASGVEPNEGFLGFSHNQLRSTVRSGKLNDVDSKKVYDLVLLIHVIEHFNRPSDSLRKIHQLIKPGGRLYIECPNVAAPHAAPGKLFHFAHVYNFTPRTLSMMVRACGFEVETWFSAEHDKELRVLLKRVETEELEIDPESYAATLAGLNRYSNFGYHFRISYLLDRVRRLAEHWSEHVFSRRRLQQIIERCQTHAEAARPGTATEPEGRRAA